MKKFEILTNPYFGEEKCLMEDGKVIVQGDYYHDKIKDYIKGFLRGLKYAGVEFEVSESEKAWKGCYKE